MQSGRSKVQRNCAAEGFSTEYPYTGVTVVAENVAAGDDHSASIAVETIRDIFAEGVAFGIEDALRDSFDEAAEAIQAAGGAGCSAAALAFSATHVWYAMAGNCRIYRIDDDGVKCIVMDNSMAGSSGTPVEHPDFMRQVRSIEWWLGASGQGKPVLGHTRIRKDTTYLVMTSGGWVQFESISPSLSRKGMRRTLHGWLTNLSRDLKLAYRRQGGALAAVSGDKSESVAGFSWKVGGILVACLALVWFLVMGFPVTCSDDVSTRSDLFQNGEDSVEVVQPLAAEADTVLAIPDEEPDSGILVLFRDSLNGASQTESLPDLAGILPLETAWIGTDSPLVPADSFSVSINEEPDSQWENFAPGIYFIREDTASTVLAEAASRLYPSLELFELERIVTVRENGVSDSARWLSSLPAEQASETGVIVETRSSVAGGADWIRNYPVFANGNRAERADDSGGFYGDSLSDIPLLRSENTYRLIVVTQQ